VAERVFPPDIAVDTIMRLAYLRLAIVSTATEGYTQLIDGIMNDNFVELSFFALN
jgi:hypothetical protein